MKGITVEKTIEKAEKYVNKRRKDNPRNKNQDEIILKVIYEKGKNGASQHLFDKSKFKLEKGKPNDISALRASSNFKNIGYKVGIRPVFQGFEKLLNLIVKNPDSSRISGAI